METRMEWDEVKIRFSLGPIPPPLQNVDLLPDLHSTYQKHMTAPSFLQIYHRSKERLPCSEMRAI